MQSFLSGFRQYFELVSTIALKNISVRYKNSFLGFIWSLLTPMLYLTIFIFVFSNVFSNLENYPLYVMTGLIFWTFFTGASMQIIRSVLDSASVLKSINIPPIVFPVSALISAVINLLLSLVPFFIIMLFFGFRPGAVTFMIIPFAFMLGLFVFGISLILCAVNIYFRDVEILWNTLNPALFYITPIAYSVELIPAKYLWIIKLNPLYYFMQFSRSILYKGEIPSAETFVATILLTIFFLFLGLFTFKKLKKGFYTNL